MNCTEAIDLFMWGCDMSYLYKDVINEARLLMNRHWHVVIDHVEGNF